MAPSRSATCVRLSAVPAEVRIPSREASDAHLSVPSLPKKQISVEDSIAQRRPDLYVRGDQRFDSSIESLTDEVVNI